MLSSWTRPPGQPWVTCWEKMGRWCTYQCLLVHQEVTEWYVLDQQPMLHIFCKRERKKINILCCLLQSVVENNVYKESYITFLCYEHIYSHVFMDDTEIETRHRQLWVIETPLVSRIPFAIDGEIITMPLPLYNRLILFLWLMQVIFLITNMQNQYFSAFLHN